jgi:putative membrane protein
MEWGDHGGGWAVGMALLMLLFWGSLVAVGVFAVRSLTHRPDATPTAAPPARPDQEARAILAQRLARGDIDPQEYRERLQALDG